jgi:hypothetical protein
MPKGNVQIEKRLFLISLNDTLKLIHQCTHDPKAFWVRFAVVVLAHDPVHTAEQGIPRIEQSPAAVLNVMVMVPEPAISVVLLTAISLPPEIVHIPASSI